MEYFQKLEERENLLSKEVYEESSFVQKTGSVEMLSTVEIELQRRPLHDLPNEQSVSQIPGQLTGCPTTECKMKGHERKQVQILEEKISHDSSEFKICIVPHGQDISKVRIRLWISALQKKESFYQKDFIQLEACKRSEVHVLVVDSRLQQEKLAEWCQLRKRPLEGQDITVVLEKGLQGWHVVTPLWLTDFLAGKLEDPAGALLDPRYAYPLTPQPQEDSQGSVAEEDEQADDNPALTTLRKNCPWLEAEPAQDPMRGQPRKRRRPDPEKFACQITGTVQATNMNSSITDHLEPLVEIYQVLGDRWRQYGYKKAVGILKSIPFQVIDEDGILKISKIRGFGKQMVDKVRKILNEGYLDRLVELKKDPYVETVLQFARIWGVGPTTAKKLYKQGFRSLDDLRSDKGQEALNKQQIIGLNRYDDLLQRIPRDEVGEIETLVVQEAQKLCPGIQGMACGSYRRGKSSMGDVDIIFCLAEKDDEALRTGASVQSETSITEDNVDLLPDLVDRLTEIKFLTDHLQMPSTYDPLHHQTYMGICRLNKPNTLCRRLDLKVYSRKAYPFALLYFTGSDHFNRSMRLYAKHLGFSLTDEGLFPASRVQGEKVWTGDSIDCRSEEEIFKALGLQYKSPNERNCFDVRFVEEEENDYSAVRRRK